jgi:hypothetical protein
MIDDTLSPEFLNKVMAGAKKEGSYAIIQCNKCGVTEEYIPGINDPNMTRAEAEKQVKEGFVNTKTWFSLKGWKTSVGYDLCTDCARNV